MSEKLIEYFAHSLEGQPKSKWQPLKEHLQNVAEMAAGFAEPFGGEEWAYLAEASRPYSTVWFLSEHSHGFHYDLLRAKKSETV